MTNNNQEKLLLSEFRLEDATQVYVPKDKNKTFDYSDGLIVENEILKTISSTKDISSTSTELLKKANNWPSYYHLSITRSNMLRAINFSPESNVLELGAGCGAITRYLGETFNHADAVEGSYKRAQIARQRCRDLKNTNIFCANFKNLNLKNEHDIVFMIGSLEYSPLFFSDTAENSINAMISIAKSAVKKDGLIVIAIENKIGIKYWSGCQEDHTSTLYDSIHNYPNKPCPITFSKKEIKTILNKNALKHTAFFSCYPDYKFTATILNDNIKSEGLYLHNWIETPFASYSKPRINAFNESLAIKTLSNSGLLNEFANSFLIIASNEQIQDKIDMNSWAAKKLPSQSRKEQYKCVTTLKIEPNIQIEKTPINKNTNDNKENDQIKQITGNNKWEHGDLMLFSVLEAFYSKNFNERILKLLQKYYKELVKQYSENRTDEDGYPILKSNSFDFIFRNIIEDGETLKSIDEEWELNKTMSADFILFRCLQNDICLSNQKIIYEKIKNMEDFTIKTIQYFFPQYNLNRHKLNKEKEKFLVSQVMNELKFNPFINPSNETFFKNKFIWKFLFLLWKPLPNKLKIIIKSKLLRIT